MEDSEEKIHVDMLMLRLTGLSGDVFDYKLYDHSRLQLSLVSI